jgi:hypothetical protein
MRVAQGAAYPLITSLRRLSSVFMSGLGSTTAVALGTGLGVLRLGLGVMKFLVQLGVFASGENAHAVMLLRCDGLAAIPWRLTRNKVMCAACSCRDLAARQQWRLVRGWGCCGWGWG